MPDVMESTMCPGQWCCFGQNIVAVTLAMISLHYPKKTMDKVIPKNVCFTSENRRTGQGYDALSFTCHSYWQTALVSTKNKYTFLGFIDPLNIIFNY